MVSARDFRNGEVVRFKTVEEQPDYNRNYDEFYGHICIVTDITGNRSSNQGDEHDCVTVRSIATGEEIICFVRRLEKHHAPDG